MDLLERKVKEDGIVIDEKILKVDGFKSSNRCRPDAQVGQTFYEQFKDEGITKY